MWRRVVVEAASLGALAAGIFLLVNVRGLWIVPVGLALLAASGLIRRRLVAESRERASSGADAELLTAEQVAARFGTDETAVLNMALRSGLPYVRTGRRWQAWGDPRKLRFRLEEVDEWWEGEQQRLRRYGVEP